MDIIQIEFFRGILRLLEREIGFQTDSESVCCGVTLSQCHVMMELSHRKEASVKELSEALGIDKSALSRTADKMVESGLLNRNGGKSDRRYVSLSLTEKGHAGAETINRICNEYYMKLFERIPADKHQTVIESIALLAEGMKALRMDKDGVRTGCCN